MPSIAFTASQEEISDKDLAYITTALRGIRFGSVEIVIHDSRIVQIERKEKVRLER
ncbi:MAG: hypothetical protein OJF47_001333 [Nitrospira sp.]|jgi:hypothetical protein|nr:MAG: hypothetical protein OJF47_001333 [Nitrospira sp.]